MRNMLCELRDTGTAKAFDETCKERRLNNSKRFIFNITNLKNLFNNKNKVKEC